MASSLKRKRVQDNPHAKSKRRHTTPDSEDSGLSQASAHADFEEHESEDVGSDASSEGHVELLEPAGDTQESDAAIHVKAPPKGEELRDIKDATDLFRSTSFKLQIDALLPNVRAKYHRSAPLDKFLLSLHTFLSGLPSIPPKHPLAASRDLQKKGVAVPYVLPQPTEDTNWKVAFEKPAEILLVGSWALKTSVKAKDGRRYVVDLAVTMPESLFQEKDYLHSRFFQKRAFYLAVIAAAVSGKKSGLNIEVLYESTNGDPRLTTLVLRPKADGSASDFSSLNTEVAENGGQFGGFGKKEKRRPLGKGLSSYQLFKAALDLLARYDFAKNRTVIKSKDGHRFPPEDYASHEAALVDSSSMLNLLAGVPLTSLEMLRYDAQQTLDVLDNSGLSEDPFPLVFLKEQRDVANRFDVVLRIDLSSAEAGNLPPHAILEHGSAYNALIAHLLSTAKRALSNRTRAIAVLHPSSSSRPLSQAQPSNPSTVLLGLVLDTEHAFRLVDHGPPASEQETEEAKQFRDFWGEKAELRRFKDGSIVESVVWTVGSSDERAHIPAMIVRYILGLHLGLSEESIHGWQNGFDGIVRLPEDVGKVFRDGRVETGFKAAMSAFDSLVKAMKALDEQLPLAITTPSPPPSRPLCPLAHGTSPPMEIIVEFEKSGRWPDDLRATQKIKLAFFEALATALMGSQKGLRASVIVSSPHAASDIEDQACLEIVTAAGWAFHARIWHDREQLLLERAIDDKPHIPKHVKKNMHMEGDPKERAAATAALEVYRRRFVHAPRHHRAVAALSHRFSAFAGTARLVKRWLAAHWLLEGHVRAEAAELLCAAVFLRGAKSGGDARAGVPGSKERGFARVMELLKDWEWSAGMFVSLYGDDSDAVKDVPSVGVDVKAGARQGVWAIATEVDREGHVWTAEGPDAVVARRVKALAQATWEALKGMEGGNFEVKTLFAHPTEHYDFIVELDPAVLPRYAQGVQAEPAIWAKKGKYANARGDDGEAKLLPGFDPARAFYEDLKRVYEHTFVLFHDPLGGHMFGGVWDPSLKAPRPFRVLGGFSSMPVAKDTDKPKEREKDKSLVVLNESAVLSEIERMGRGLVKRIVVQV
ncbi:hypothetical protein EVJ58_g7084 [Rhodofomes roseus]|uniref:U3 small nucleolar RNA-associated protein 22 n=1 Tax=Rhodofomes roseus TaxID=34475 RepID=A0A4Y9Y5F0_9APHY|nr:hypothetical protein EVJ58_g7084 [Rhodofomes roseus]